MKKKEILWLVASCLMALSLVLAACGPAAPTTPTTPSTPTTPTTPSMPTTPTPTTPTETPTQKEVVSSETPQYGGRLTLLLTSDVSDFDSIASSAGAEPINLSNQGLWEGDWAKGPAGGYGTHQTDWTFRGDDLFAYKRGVIAESTTWTIDEANDVGTIVYKIRQGVHYGLNPNSEASRLVGGREVTVDDVIHTLQRAISDSKSYIWRTQTELRGAEITKTGPWEITAKVPLAALINAISRFGDSTYIQPPEVIEKYGNMSDWKRSVGTGPFMIVDNVPGSQVSLVKNPNFWEKDPVGPGKGNDLPYLDEVRFLIIPDASTRQAALRTAKVDAYSRYSLSWEDAAIIRKTTPQLKEVAVPGSGGPLHIRTDEAAGPLHDVRVRQAMMMAIDFEAIRQSVNGGLGEIVTFPFGKNSTYIPLYVGIDDPEMPPNVKELYTYNPEKAKQLLAEAGYPNGFKTSILLTATDVDYYSIYKSMWEKVGIDTTLDVKESGVLNTITDKNEHTAMAVRGWNPYGIFYSLPTFHGDGYPNLANVHDPLIDKAMEEIRLTAPRDLVEAMNLMRKLILDYLLENVYAIPRPQAPTYHFWWPWVKNYSGEQYVGYINVSWPQWVWIDQNLKKSMGY